MKPKRFFSPISFRETELELELLFLRGEFHKRIHRRSFFLGFVSATLTSIIMWIILLFLE
jgi:hypothetical protein